MSCSTTRDVLRRCIRASGCYRCYATHSGDPAIPRRPTCSPDTRLIDCPHIHRRAPVPYPPIARRPRFAWTFDVCTCRILRRFVLYATPGRRTRLIGGGRGWRISRLTPLSQLSKSRGSRRTCDQCAIETNRREQRSSCKCGEA